MNTPLLFLLGAVALSALGGIVVWIASRPRPERFGSTIDSFSRDLDALAPPGSQPRRSDKPAGAPRVARPQPASRVSAGAPTNRPRPGPRPTERSGGN